MQTVIRLWVLLVLCGFAVFSWADPLVNDWGREGLILFNAKKNQMPDSTNQSRQLDFRERLSQLQLPDTGGLEKYSVKAHLTWVMQQQSVVTNTKDFIWPTDFSQVEQGWAGHDSLYSWHSQLGRQTPLTLNLSPAIAKRPFHLADYDEFWIDYSTMPGSNKLCDMQLEFRGLLKPHNNKEKPPKTVLLSTASDYNLKVLKTLDTSNATFIAKDYSYILGRVLGLAPDENWHFVQTQKNTLAQRRMHLNLDSAIALDIAFPTSGVERVNLRVSLKDGHGEGELLEFDDLSPNHTLPDGSLGVRLNLGDALAKRFPREWEENSKEAGANSFYLQEVFLYFPGDALTIAESNPMIRLTLQGVLIPKDAQERLTLNSQVVNINSTRNRLKVDIRQLALMGDIDLTHANLILYSMKNEAWCKLYINDVRTVTTSHVQIPAFVENLAGWLRGRGGPFFKFVSELGQFEHPGIVNFLPFSSFSLLEHAQLQKQKYFLRSSNESTKEVKLIGVDKHLPDFQVLTEAGKDVTFENRYISNNSGATITFHGQEPTISVDGDNLVLKGYSDTLEITWPMATRLFENTWFYFGVTEGEQQIGLLSLTAEFADGHRISRLVETNKPFRIDSGDAQLTKLRLSFEPRAKPFLIKLRELALFSSKIATYAEARFIPLPINMLVKPKPTLNYDTKRLLESGRGYVVGELGNQPLRFLTLLDKQLDWVRGFNLGFRFPLESRVNEKCPLMIQLNWTNGQKILRQICPKQKEGSIFLPLANFLGPENYRRNLGSLKSIEWIVAESGSRAMRGEEHFYLSFSIIGSAMLSAVDQVRLSPLILYGQNEVYAADMPNFGNTLSDSYSNTFWLPLETAPFEKILTNPYKIVPVNHSFFKLNKVVAEPDQRLDVVRWGTLLVNSPPRWPKLLLWVSVMALVWAAWKKGWWLICKLGRIFLVSGKVLFGLARITKQRNMSLRRLLLLLGVLLILAGMVFAGNLGFSFHGAMLLIGLIKVFGVVFDHWEEGTSRNWHKRDWFVLTLSCGCAAWSLGYFGLQYDAAWGLLPLMGFMFDFSLSCLKYLPSWWHHKRHYLLLTVWAALTLLLFGIGLILKIGNGENYFFTFGDIVAVMVVRELFLVVEPRFRMVLPNIANPVYGGAGSLYFVGALVLLVGTATMSSLKLEPIAEQLAVVIYYCLVVGTVLEIVALRQKWLGKTEQVR